MFGECSPCTQLLSRWHVIGFDIEWLVAYAGLGFQREHKRPPDPASSKGQLLGPWVAYSKQVGDGAEPTPGCCGGRAK